MSRYFIELAYNGLSYHGWQIQPNAVSVQHELTYCISKVLGHKVNLVGCGRTDTGVNASYFVAHFDCENDLIDSVQFCNKLNRFLSKNIALYSITKVDDNAHSRFSAVSRTYKYWVVNVKNPFLHTNAYCYYGDINFDMMNVVSKVLMEYTDFTSFSKLHTDVKTNNCNVMEAGWEFDGVKWVFTIKADRFLRNMVRAIVGTLFEVGKGRIDENGFRSIIEQKNRGDAGVSVPAHALYLVDVNYPSEIFMPVFNKLQM
ncbi:MAG: tRNA pseudouridine(38-40) synthase TruA [Marinilabiliaceae bacterium]|nr:tRNA pseudouridine(38-40) synthase TruA [Marinilabiliaceae bacterium]